MKAQIILNPTANSGRAQKQVPAICRAFDDAGIDYDMLITTHAQQATQAAFKAAENGVDMVVAAGGDGTINEVINGLVRQAGPRPTKPLGIIPIGTGNDFSDMQGLPHDFGRLVADFKQGNTRQIDIGQVALSPTRYHYFDNNCALAMEPRIALENQKNKRFKGQLGYIFSVLKALFNLQAWQMNLTWDRGSYEGKVLLLSVCNGPRTGSAFMMCPAAKVDDGLFDVVLIPEVPLRTVLNILPRLFNGSHLKHPAVQSFQTRELTISSTPGSPCHADGEILTAATETAHYTLLPKKLTLLIA